MSIVTKVFIALIGIIFVGAIVYLLVKRKINERHSLFWLFGAFIILILSLIPELLEIVADLMGVAYPPTLLFLFAILIILLITLYQSIQISILQERLKELTQQMVIENMNSSNLINKGEDYANN